ncbi:MAG TPA: ABC transporter permease [Humisphaera sp.]
MIFVALKMLVGDRLKYVALVAGVAFAALLITQQASIFTGYSMRTGSWVADLQWADLWVMDPQVRFADDIKPVQETALQRVRGVPGVASAVPLYKGYLKCRLPDGTLLQSRVIGLDDATLAGGPPEVLGQPLTVLRQDKAVLVNSADLADKLRLTREADRPLDVGERISLNDHEAVVVGTYKATPEFFWEPVIYTTYSRALSMAPPERKLTQYVLVKLAPGADRDAVAREIKAVTGLDARTPEAFRWAAATYIINKTGILVNFGMTIGLGFVIGLLVAGQTFYTFVIDNLRHFGALKAMGASNGAVLRMLVTQVVVVGAVGYGLGLGVASLTGILFESIGLAFRMTWHIPAVGGAAVLACCMMAGVFGMFRVLRLEPAVVFKA